MHWKKHEEQNNSCLNAEKCEYVKTSVMPISPFSIHDKIKLKKTAILTGEAP